MDNKQNQTNINWFPGHMTKAKREIEERLKQVDLVIELRDARIVEASRNPLINEIVKDKPKMIVLTKADKAEAKETKKWIDKFTEEGIYAISLDCSKPVKIDPIINLTKEVMKKKIERDLRKGIRPRASRAMVLGIPNVGKSTFINRIAKKNVVVVANKPGVTRAQKIIKINDALELLDTPGVLWPKFEDERVALNLAVTGSIKDQVLPLEVISNYALMYLSLNYAERMKERYKIELLNEFDEISCEKYFYQLGEKRLMLKAKAEVDVQKARETFIKEVRDGLLGNITWEKVYE